MQTDLQKAIEAFGITFDTSVVDVLDKLVYLSLKDVLEDYEGALMAAADGECRGYYSWDNLTLEAAELDYDVHALQRVLNLYEVLE